MVGPHAFKDATVLHSRVALEWDSGACSTSVSLLFWFRLFIGATLAIIQLRLNELFISNAYPFNVRWLMMNDYEMLRMFRKYV